MGRKFGAVSLPALLLALAGGNARAQEFVEIDTPGNIASAQAISGDGSTGVGYATTDFDAYKWDEDGVPTLIQLGARAYGVNVDGSIIVGAEEGPLGSLRAIKWVNGVATQLSNGDFGQALDVSDDGAVIVGDTVSSGNTKATIWTSSGDELLEDLVANTSTATGVSGDGSIIVGYGNELLDVALVWKWDGSQYQGDRLDFLSSEEDARALGISADGTTAVGYSEDAAGDDRAVKWNTGTLAVTELDVIGEDSRAYSANGDGSVIVGRADMGTGSAAVRWTDNGAEILQDVLIAAGVDMTGWELTQAIGVSDDGLTIIGNGSEGPWIMRNNALVTPDGVVSSLASVGQVAAGADSFVAGFMTGAQEYALQHATDTVSTQSTLGYAADPGANFPNIKRNNDAPRWRVFGYAEGYGSSELDGGHGLGQVGASYLFADYSLVGASLGFGGSTTDMEFDGEAEFLGVSGTVFAAYAPPTGFQAVFTATAAGLDADIARGYMNGAGTTTSEGETDGYGAGASLRVGYAFQIADTTRLTPFGSATVTHVNLDGYTETTGPFPATVEELEDTVVVGRLGAEVRHDLSQATWIWASAAWAHRDNDEGAEVTATATGLFGITSAALTTAQDWAEVTGGISVGLDDGVSRFTASATAYIPDEDISVAGRIGFSRAF
jgi:uncharacterized membrane protein